MQDETRLLHIKMTRMLRPKLRRWVMYEWFCSPVDYGWYADNEFTKMLQASPASIATASITTTSTFMTTTRTVITTASIAPTPPQPPPRQECGLGHVTQLMRKEWAALRTLFGRPRRLSDAFLKQEKAKLYAYRGRVRALRRMQATSAASAASLESELGLHGSAQMAVGQRVTALHPKARHLYTGTVLTPDGDHYRVQFDVQKQGVQARRPVAPPPAPSSRAPDLQLTRTLGGPLSSSQLVQDICLMPLLDGSRGIDFTSPHSTGQDAPSDSQFAQAQWGGGGQGGGQGGGGGAQAMPGASQQPVGADARELQLVAYTYADACRLESHRLPDQRRIGSSRLRPHVATRLRLLERKDLLGVQLKKVCEEAEAELRARAETAYGGGGEAGGEASGAGVGAGAAGAGSSTDDAAGAEAAGGSTDPFSSGCTSFDPDVPAGRPGSLMVGGIDAARPAAPPQPLPALSLLERTLRATQPVEATQLASSAAVWRSEMAWLQARPRRDPPPRPPARLVPSPAHRKSSAAYHPSPPPLAPCRRSCAPPRTRSRPRSPRCAPSASASPSRSARRRPSRSRAGWGCRRRESPPHPRTLHERGPRRPPRGGRPPPTPRLLHRPLLRVRGRWPSSRRARPGARPWCSRSCSPSARAAPRPPARCATCCRHPRRSCCSCRRGRSRRCRRPSAATPCSPRSRS